MLRSPFTLASGEAWPQSRVASPCVEPVSQLIRPAVILAFVCSLLAPNLAAARQATTLADTVPDGIVPTVNAARARIVPTRSQKRNRLPLLFYGALESAAVAVAALHIDPDTGGYRDGGPPQRISPTRRCMRSPRGRSRTLA